MKTSISKMLSRVIALALVFCLSAQMMPLQIMANDYRNKQLDKQIADKQSEIEKLETEVENMLGHEIGVNAAAEAQSAPVMMAANTDDIVTVDHVVDGATVGTFTFDKSTGTITKFNQPSGSSYTVTIPSEIGGVPVTAIGDNAFQNSTMTAVIVPDSVTTIGYAAFYSCSGLTAIEIPKSVTTLGSFAFQNCTGLTNVTIPNTVTTLGTEGSDNGLFYGCTKLKSVTIETNISVIPSQMFYNCKELETVRVNGTITEIEEYAFNECRVLTNFTIPASVTSIGERAFFNCKAITGTLDLTNVSVVGTEAFAGTNVSSVKLPADMSGFGSYIFSAAPLANVEFAKGTTYIPALLANSTSLETVEIPDTVTSLADRVFSGCSALTSVKLPSGLETIPQYAFENCKSLTNITLPDSVTTIGAYAFINCSGLTTVSGMKSVTEIEKGVFNRCSSLENIDISKVTSIGGYAFEYCSALKSVTLNDSVRFASNAVNIFRKSGLVSITIPGSVTAIPQSCFEDCTSLKTVTAENLYSIGKYAFLRCTSLTATPDLTDVRTIGDNAFDGCTALTQVDLYAVENYLTLYSNVFANCTNLKKIVLHSSKDYFAAAPNNLGTTMPFANTPDNLEFVFVGEPEEIGVSLFCNAPFVKNLSFIPDSVTTYGDYAFKYCKFTEITIPANITTVGDACFSNCDNLVKVTVENAMSAWNITYWDYSDGASVPGHAFFYNTPLHNTSDVNSTVDITFPENWTEIPFGFFAGSKIRDTWFLEDMPNLEKIGAYAFRSCAQLENIVIPNGVKTLGYGVFYDALKNVTQLRIPASVTSLEKKSGEKTTGHFYMNSGNYGLTDIYFYNPELDLYHDSETAEPIFNANKFSATKPLTIHGLTDSTAEAFCDGDKFVFVSIGTVGAISVSVVVTENGLTPITEGFTVEWKNAEGQTVSENTTFKPSDAGLNFTYNVNLSDGLKVNYYLPENITGAVTSSEEPQEIEVVLNEIKPAKFTINAPSGALVELTQNINGVVTGSEQTVGENETSVTFSAKKAYTEITVSLDDYYTEYAVISEENVKTPETNTVNIEMKKLPATSVIINATSKLDGDASPVFDLSDFTFTVKTSEDETFVPTRVEGGMLYLDEPETEEGETETASAENEAPIPAATDELKLYVEVNPTSDLIAPVNPIAFTFADEEINIEFTSRGHITLNAKTENQSEGFYLWIFDANGKLIDAYDMRYGENKTDPLPQGSYNVVAIDMAVGINSVPNISVLNKFGLSRGSHYYQKPVDDYQKPVDVVDGNTAALGNITVPNYLDFNLYVDMFEQAQFDSNVSEPNIGQSFYLWFDYKLNGSYASAEGNKEIVIQLPQGTRLNACHTPEGIGSYSYNEETYTLTVTTTVTEGRVYLALACTEADRYASASATAKVNIGEATYMAKPVSYDVPVHDIRIEAQDVMNGEIFARTIKVYTQPYAKNVMLYVNGEPYRTSRIVNGGYIDNDTSYEETPYGTPEFANGDGVAVFHNVRLPGPASSSKTWALTASAEIKIDGETEKINIRSTEKKIIAFSPDPFDVVVQIPSNPPYNINGKIYYNDYETLAEDSQYNMGEVKTGQPVWYWKAYVTPGMGEYIDRFWLKFRGGSRVSYMELNRIGADCFGAEDEVDRNLWMSFLDYTYTLKDSYYEEYLNEPVPVSTADESTAAEKAKAFEKLNAELAKLEELEEREGFTFAQLEAEASDEEKAAILKFKAAISQAAADVQSALGINVNGVSEENLSELLEAMGVSTKDITENELKEYANDPDFTAIKASEDENAEIIRYVKVDEKQTISVDVDNKTVTTHDYTKLTSGKEQTFSLKKSSRSGGNEEDLKERAEEAQDSIKETTDLVKKAQFAIGSIGSAAEGISGVAGKLGKAAGALGAALNYALQVYDFYSWMDMISEINGYFDKMASLRAEEKQVMDNMNDYNTPEACIEAIGNLRLAYFDLVIAILSKLLAYNNQLVITLVSILLAAVSLGTSVFVINTASFFAGNAVDEVLDENIERARQQIRMFQKDKARDCRQDRDEDKDDADCNPIYDPSGYVYEGVFSNRVEGATVTTYKYGQTDENGEQIEWNAEDFSQENPLITNSDGYYRWDVPVGYYKVVAEKEGYEAADTTDIYSKDKLGKDRNDISDGTHVDFDGKTVPAGWHKVLPVQTEVHIPLESKQAPTVESALAYSDSIIVQFSQYMKEKTVADNISVTMGGVEYKGEDLKIEWPDREMSDHYYNRTFASQLKISRADGETWTDEVTVSITGGENYAGTAFAAWNGSLSVIPVIDKIEADSAVEINYDESKEVTIKLVDARGNGIARIPVELSTGNMVVFEETTGEGSETVETTALSDVSDANGQVTFTVKANYPGDDTIVVTIPGRDETWEIPVAVGTEYSQTVVSEPVVTINGTEYRGQGHRVTVPSGTVITVTGENADKLYYAIGESNCPCQDEQIEITNGQVILTESGYYKFAAFADGVYSSRVHINITVTNEGGAGSGEGESGGSGTGTGGTAPVTPPSAENNFTDVAENAYYYDAVMWALENGITTGVSEDKFAPDMECSRAQAVTFLWRAAGEPKPKDSSMPFSDVAENAYYRDAVLWAVENGITNGTGEDSFSPDMKCTREQIVTFLWRTAKHLGMDVSVGEDTNSLSYDDAFDIGEWATPAVQWACGAGVMNGTSESALSPQMVCSRAQIVTFLYRTFK